MLNRVVVRLNPATVALVALVACAALGCFGQKKKTAAEPSPGAFTIKEPGSNTNLVITLAHSVVGRVASVNAQAKFAVVSFPIGQVPANETRFSIFHAGMKTGELKVTGPAQENFTVGDIIAGSALEGDEVRGE